MKAYIGTKMINAVPMNRLEYNQFRGWTLPADENGADEGYLVEYVGPGQKPNTAEYEGYVSWSPKDVFDEAYTPITNMDFGGALVMLKDGEKVARAGWNGKGMYITMKPGYPEGIACNEATAKAHGIEVGTKITYCPYLEMKTADNKLVPWLASQTDILAEDWTIVQ